MQPYFNPQHNLESERFYLIQSSKQYQKQLSDRRYFQKLYYSSILILVAISIYLLINAPSSVSFDKLFLATLILWAGFFPGLYYLKDPKRPPLPFLPLIGLFYSITFGLPIFLSDDVEVIGLSQLSDVNNTTLTLTLIGLLGMGISFYISKSYIWRNIKAIQLAKSFSINRLSILLWLLLIGHIVYIYIPVLQTIPSIGQLLEPGGLLCYGIFYLIWSEGKLPFMQTALLVCVFVPLEILATFTSGLLSQLMSIALFMIFVVWYKHRRVPMLLITATLLLFMLFNPVKDEYRSLTWWKGESSQDNILEKAQLFSELAIDHFNYENPNPDLLEEDDSHIARIAHIATFAQVIKDTPTIVPYWNGYSYGALFTKMIPRIVWPDKPTESIGNEFGQRYHYLHPTDTTTSINLPWLIELYANFGTIGVLLGMPFFGVFLAFVEQKFNNKQMNIIEVIIGITVTFSLAYQESNFSLMIGGIFSLTLALYFIFKFFVANKVKTSG